MISSPDIVKSVAQRDVNAVRITTVDVIHIESISYGIEEGRADRTTD